MRTLVIGGCLLLLLLISIAYVVHRRSRAAAAPPARLDRAAPGPAPPALVFEPSVVDVGALVPGEARRIDVLWRRTGPGTLRVRAVHTGCGCVVASGLGEVLPFGASGALVVEVRSPSTPGPFDQSVRVITDRPPDDVARFRVRGFAGTAPVLSPPAISLGAVSPGTTLRRGLALRTPPGVVGEVSVAFDAVRGEGEVRAPRELGASGHDVALSMAVPAVPGPFRGWVEVGFSRAGRRERTWRVPVTGEVVAPEPAPAPSAPERR